MESVQGGTQDGPLAPAAVDPRPLVFVSYRADSDEPLAEAVRGLIEKALDPAPRVFLSGPGGLRPSALSHPTQLQEAAMRAAAFVSLVTTASRDRGWIQFEAGAAWGRQRLYAPVLVDVSAAELESAFGSYAPVKADDRGSVRDLVENLASAVNAKVRSHFGQRFAALGRAIAKHRVGSSEPEADDDPDAPGGLHDLADLERNADPAVASQVQIVRAACDLDRPAHERLAALENLKEVAGDRPEYSLWHGWLESEPLAAIADLERYLSGPVSEFGARQAFRRMVSLLHEAGQGPEALARVLQALTGQDRNLRQTASVVYCEIWEAADPLARLAAAVVGLLASASAEVLRLGGALANAQGWCALGAYLARRCESLSHDGSAACMVGMAYDRAGLSSVAFEAFQRASSLGVPVARARMASLLARGAVPAAGLDLLPVRDGGLDGVDLNYEHGVRSELEKATSDQRKVADDLEAAGRRLFRKLSMVVPQGLRPPQPDVLLGGRYRVDGGEVVVEPSADGGGLLKAGSRSAALGGADRALSWLVPGASLVGSSTADSMLVLAARPDGLWGVLAGPSDEGRLVRLERMA
jgi:hypothetical protein